MPEKTPNTSRELDRLAEQTEQLDTLVGRYYTRQGQLHGQCFYLGLCEPLETTERRIRAHPPAERGKSREWEAWFPAHQHGKPDSG